MIREWRQQLHDETTAAQRNSSDWLESIRCLDDAMAALSHARAKRRT
jgi:hypothetical protein